MITEQLCTYTARIIDKQEANILQNIYKLRYDIIVKEQGWLEEDNFIDELEYDEYDEYCIDFGVFNNQNEVVAYSRILLPSHTFMLEKAFKDLIINYPLRKNEKMVEISRIVVSPDHRGLSLNSATFHLYNILTNWCLENGYTYTTGVVERRQFFALKRRGFDCKKIGQSHEYQAGLEVFPLIIDFSTSTFGKNKIKIHTY